MISIILDFYGTVRRIKVNIYLITCAVYDAMISSIHNRLVKYLYQSGIVINFLILNTVIYEDQLPRTDIIRSTDVHIRPS